MKILKSSIDKKETKAFLDHLQFFNTISKSTKKEILSTVWDSITYKNIWEILCNLSDMSKKEIIKIVPKLKKQQIKNIDFQDPKIQKEIANILYKEYVVFYQKRKHNNITFTDAVKYSTTVNHLKHRTKFFWKYWEWNYFLEHDEPWVQMWKTNEKEEKTESNEKTKNTITKYFWPIFIRTKRVTKNTINDIQSLINQNSKYKTDENLQLKEWDFILEFDIWPSDISSLKKGFEDFKKYLKSWIYTDILERNNFWIENKDDITIKFVYGITAINILAKRQGRNVLNMPREDAKRTATFMYGMINPYAEVFEQPGILKLLSHFDKNAKYNYEKLKAMAQKFDVRDIKFCYTTPEKILETEK